MGTCSRDRASWVTAVCLATLAACGGGSGAAKTGSAGSDGGAGTGTAGTTGAAGNSSAGTTGAAGTTGMAGTKGSAGTTGTAGTTGAAGTSDASDAGTDTGGAKTCGGNALSLSANGTGTNSDAARARVVFDLMTDLPMGNAPRTVEFWMYVRPTDWLGERNEIYVYGAPGTTATAFGLDFGTFAVDGMPTNHATLNPYTNGGFNEDSKAYLGVDSSKPLWVHVAMTWDGTTLRTYVNGVPRIATAATGGITALATASSPVTFGCNPPIYNCFGGLFDEIRVWKVTRSAAEIMAAFDKSLTGTEAGLVGYWKLDEAPGATTAADSVTSSGHTAHPGTLMASASAQMPTFVTPDPPAPIKCP